LEFIHRQGDRIPEIDEIERGGPPVGKRALEVLVHRTRFRIEGADEELLASAGPVFEGFLDEGGAEAEREITLSFTLGGSESFLAFRTTPEPETYRILVSRSERGYRIVSYHFAAHYEVDRRRVRVLLARGPGRREERLLDNLFRVIAGYAFIEEGAVLVHAAALAVGERGYVFYGPSGAGKTTVSRLSLGRADLLSDDQALLSLEGEQVLLSATPFRGGERLHPHRHEKAIAGPNRNRTVPLAGLFRLVQAERLALAELSPSRQLASLLSAVPVFPGEPYNNARLMATLSGVIERVPAQELHFLPDAGFWDLLEGGR
jgi:hypothetical protein